MKKTATVLLGMVCVLVFAFSCAKKGARLNPVDPQAENYASPTPAVKVYQVSGVVVNNLLASVSGVVIKIYELDSTAQRVGEPYSTVSAGDGSWGPVSALAGKHIEAELSKPGFAWIDHYYLAPIVADRSDGNFIYNEAISPPTSPGGVLAILIDRKAFNIASTDNIQIDGGANINNATVSNGTAACLHVAYFANGAGAGDMLGFRDLSVSAAASPGQLHQVTFKDETLAVRVFPNSSYHITDAVFGSNPPASPTPPAGAIGKDWTQATAAAFFSGKANPTSALVFNSKMWLIDCGLDVTYSTDGANWTTAVFTPDYGQRAACTGIVYDSKLWVIGGFDGAHKNDVWYSSDGAAWTEATAAASFGGRAGHASVVYDSKMWVIGGLGAVDMNDVWSSSDGVTWTEATAAAAFSARNGLKSVAYDGKMWVLGGGGANDVWYSTDGISWTEATATAFSYRSRFSCVVHDGKMWVIGGGFYKNDVYYSTDGANWTQATAAADFSARSNHVSVSYDNKIWVICGSDSGGTTNDVWYSP